ncbi:hypothetical protein K7G98_26660, partial [Saccharothrix sp. MB29]|nr:hypothetical protein [Saccharothrix sp. MB29]
MTNQVPPLEGHDVSADPALLEALHRGGAGWAETSWPSSGGTWFVTSCVAWVIAVRVLLVGNFG